MNQERQDTKYSLKIKPYAETSRLLNNRLTPLIAILTEYGVNCDPITALINYYYLQPNQFHQEEFINRVAKLQEQRLHGLTKEEYAEIKQALASFNLISEFIPLIFDFMGSLLSEDIADLKKLSNHRIPLSDVGQFFNAQVESDNQGVDQASPKINGVEFIILFNVLTNAHDTYISHNNEIGSQEKITIRVDSKNKAITITSLSQRSFGQDNIRRVLNELFDIRLGPTVLGREIIIKQEELISDLEEPFYRISITLQPKTESEVDCHGKTD